MPGPHSPNPGVGTNGPAPYPEPSSHEPQALDYPHDLGAAEMRRYGVTVNAIAPAARTRMTETVFAEMMAKPQEGFDAMAPENVSPLVVWLGSAESRDVTGKVFEVEGGIIRVAEGWAHGPQVDKGVKWDPAELGPVVSDLLAKSRPPVPVYGA